MFFNSQKENIGLEIKSNYKVAITKRNTFVFEEDMWFCNNKFV